MTTHYLKTWPEFYREIVTFNKLFEIRINDRDFKSGDIVVLREYHPKSKKYTGAEIEFKIGYVLYSDSAGIFGLKEGFCAFSLDALIDIREPGDEDNYE